MKRKADGSHHHSSNLIINYEEQPTESSQGMGDKWAKSNSVEMCETNGTAHLNGNLTPNEMFEGEEDRLVSNLANKCCKVKNTACAARDAASAALDVVHSVSNGKLSQSRLWNNLVVVLFHNKTNLLLPFGPAAAVAVALNMKQGWVFLFSLLGIAPLAERLGFLTEELAYYTGPTVGGLLNATFGNATELIISIHALRNGMIHVVKQSLLGSILSNMLLVLGCAFLCGGISNKKIQSFNKATASVNSGLLLMAVMSLLFPTVLHYTHTELHKGQSEITLSRFSSGVMLVAYAFYLFFQLKGHSEIYCSEETQGHDVEDAKEEEPETAELTFWESIIWLAVVTAFISFLSGYLVNAIEGTSENWNMPVAFISVILLPIVGNAAEHASAIMFAMKDQLDISLGVAIGSSTQISMFLIPFCVMVGWVISRPMDLNFQLFETATLFMSVLVVTFMLQEGKSNYFKGLMLVLCYLIVAASFFVHVDNTAADGD